MSQQSYNRLQKKTLTLEEKIRVLDHPKKQIPNLVAENWLNYSASKKRKRKIRAQYETLRSVNNKRSRDGKHQEMVNKYINGTA